jgi:SAM-dependent methyltransferase
MDGVIRGAVTFESVAETYDRHVGRYATSLAREHVRRLGLRRNDDVLEIGCGSGALTAALADKVGAKHVHAVERSETRVETCRNRVPGADVRVASEDALPDFGVELAVATSHLVLNLLSDADAAVRAMQDGVRRGGIVASVVWDYKAGMTMLRAFWDAALQLDPSAPDEGRTMPHCTPAALRALWSRCELDDIRTDELVVDASYESFDDLWEPFTAGVAPSGAYATALEPDDRDDLRERYFQRLGAPAGPFRLSARAWFVRGTVVRDAR